MSDEIQPFRIDVPDSVLDDLRERLARTRFPDEVNDDDWSYGTDLAYLRELVDYWKGPFDWRAQERAMNAWPGYRAVVDDHPIHFLRVEGRGPAPLPLILTHGWPWTFWDFHEVIGPLSDPGAHGARASRVP